MEMGFCRIQNLVLVFWLVTGSISTFSPETPRERKGHRNESENRYVYI